MTNIKKNFAYSSILTTSNYIFPMIIYPYVSRVLGVDNIGLCNFADAVLHYFLLFSTMGIGIIGVREIAKAKSNPQQLNKVYNSLFALNLVSSVVAIIALAIATLTVSKLYQHWELMAVGSLRVICSGLQVEWFFKGFEDFKYITIRSIIIKCIYMVSVFVFVHEADDYPIYFALFSLSAILSAIINLWHTRHYVHYHIHSISLSPYIKSFFILGGYMLLTSMYTTFNVALLGFTSGNREVGYYTTVTKLYAILLSLFSVFTGVMMPRMSALSGEGKWEEFKQMVHRSITVLTSFSIPCIFFCIVLAPQIIRVVSGAGYEGAILPMRLVMPLMLIIGYEQILIIQMLMPMKADRYILRNSIVGASVGIILAFILIPKFHSVGCAIVWLASEISVMASAQLAAKRCINLSFPWHNFSVNIVRHLPLLLLIFFCSMTPGGVIIQLAVSSIAMVFYCYILNVYIAPNQEVVNIIIGIRKRFKVLQ